MAGAANAYFANHEWGLSQAPSEYRQSSEGSMPSPATVTWRLASEVLGTHSDSEESMPDLVSADGHPL